MYKCCIFDLDGTLVNSIHAIRKSVNLTLASFGLREITVEEAMRCRRWVPEADGARLTACGDESLVNYQGSLVRYSEFSRMCACIMGGALPGEFRSCWIFES